MTKRDGNWREGGGGSSEFVTSQMFFMRAFKSKKYCKFSQEFPRRNELHTSISNRTSVKVILIILCESLLLYFLEFAPHTHTHTHPVKGVTSPQKSPQNYSRPRGLIQGNTVYPKSIYKLILFQRSRQDANEFPML